MQVHGSEDFEGEIREISRSLMEQVEDVQFVFFILFIIVILFSPNIVC